MPVFVDCFSACSNSSASSGCSRALTPAAMICWRRRAPARRPLQRPSPGPRRRPPPPHRRACRSPRRGEQLGEALCRDRGCRSSACCLARSASTRAHTLRQRAWAAIDGAPRRAGRELPDPRQLREILQREAVVGEAKIRATARSRIRSCRRRPSRRVPTAPRSLGDRASAASKRARRSSGKLGISSAARTASMSIASAILAPSSRSLLSFVALLRFRRRREFLGELFERVDRLGVDQDVRAPPDTALASLLGVGDVVGSGQPHDAVDVLYGVAAQALRQAIADALGELHGSRRCTRPARSSRMPGSRRRCR